MKYRLKELFTVEKVDVMGMQQNQIINATGLPVGIITDDDLARQYEEVAE